jgi:hypothetical protein
MKTALLFFLLGYHISCMINPINPPLPPKPFTSLRADLTKGYPIVTLDD